MISIGLPEKAQALIHHLELSKYGTHTMLYVDDVDNTIYDALELNRGIQRTFFNAATPYSFLDRLRKGDGMKDLGNILSKWNNGTYEWKLFDFPLVFVTKIRFTELFVVLIFVHISSNSYLYSAKAITSTITRWDICFPW
jgi:hypothetical protein